MNSFANVVRPSSKSSGITYDLLCILGGTLFLALLSQLSFDLWFTPVPITLQTLGVMLIGSLLGSKRGAICILVYLSEGACGLPVFAGGATGPAILLGPTGGYLLSFVASAFLIGFLLEIGWEKSYMLTLTALTLGSLLTLGIGALWLSFFVGTPQALIMGLYPFLPGCGLKIIAAIALIPFGRKALNILK